MIVRGDDARIEQNSYAALLADRRAVRELTVEVARLRELLVKHGINPEESNEQKLSASP